jgi:hypothetical protein
VRAENKKKGLEMINPLFGIIRNIETKEILVSILSDGEIRYDEFEYFLMEIAKEIDDRELFLSIHSGHNPLSL